jgi:uncharacterized protein (TIGR03083 family)
VAQVLSHLGSSSQIALGTLQAGAANPAGNQAVWDRWNALPPAGQAAEFVSWERRLVEALEALSEADLESKRIDMGFMPWSMDIATFTDMRLSEVAHHRWDVDVAFDPKAVLKPYLVPAVLGLVAMLARFSAKPIGKADPVVVHTSGPIRTYLLELSADGCSVSELDGPAPDSASTVHMPAEAFARLTAGRLSPDHTPDGVTVEGPVSLDELRKVFPGY